MCQISADSGSVESYFEKEKVDELISNIKAVMLNRNANIQRELKEVMGRYTDRYMWMVHPASG